MAEVETVLDTEEAPKEKEVQLIWEIMREHWSHGRHLDVQKATMSRLLLVVSAGVLGLIAVNGVDSNDIALTVFLFLLGIYGALFSSTYDNLYYTHMQLSKVYRDEFDGMVSFISSKEALKRKRERFPWPGPAKKTRLTKYWMSLHLLISLFGLLLFISTVTT